MGRSERLQARGAPSRMSAAYSRFWLLADSICCGVECPLVTQSGRNRRSGQLQPDAGQGHA